MIVRHVTLLPLPDSPTIPSVCTLLDRERDAVDRLDDAVLGGERGLKVLDFEKCQTGRLAESDSRVDPGV